MKISIVIPSYNKQDYVIECLDSCLKQTYFNTEVIFIDNESKDDSLKKVQDFKNKTGKNFVIDVAKNIYPHCWDECVELAEEKYITGEYYTIIGADDVIHEKYIENAVSILNKRKPLFLQSSIVWFSEDKIIRESFHEYENLNEFKQQLLYKCCVNTPSVFYKTNYKKDLQIKPKSDKYSGAADYDFYCELADNNILVENYKKWIGYYYRINEGQATWQMHKSKINYDKIIQKKWRDKWTN